MSNKKVMIRVQTELQTELHFTSDTIKRKMEYAGHVLRGSSGLSHFQVLGGKLEGKRRWVIQKEYGWMIYVNGHF